MTDSEADLVVRRTYWLALAIGSVGCIVYYALEGWRPAAAFSLGVLGSVGNFWIFDRLAHSIAPAADGETRKTPWQAGVFVVRYILLITIGYAIVQVLGVSAVAVILGLLATTAAVAVSAIIELVESRFVNRSAR